MKRILKMREPLPSRRRSWTQEVIIDGHIIELGFGEYDDGRLGEVWIDMSKLGTFARGVMGKLARTISIALQCGAPPEMIVHSLRQDEDDRGEKIDGATSVDLSDVVANWIADEIETNYCIPKVDVVPEKISTVGQGDPIPEKSAGHIPEPWRVPA